MSEIKHTPGPWKWSGRELEQDGGEWRDVIHTEVSCGSFCYGGCVDMTVSEADKRLIAAAPELLEALQLVLKDEEWHAAMADEVTPGARDNIRKARAAIAKALGDQP